MFIQKLILLFCVLVHIGVYKVVKLPIFFYYEIKGKVVNEKEANTYFLIILYCTSIFANQRVNVGWFLSPGIHEGTSEDSVSGYDYEYLQKIQSYTNWDLHYIFGSFPECEQMLLDGEVDIIGYIGKTDERLKNFNFADLPSGTVNMYLICDKDNDKLSFVDFDTFDGIKIANVLSSYREQLLENLSNE